MALEIFWWSWYVTGGVPGVEPAKSLSLAAVWSGTNAAQMAVGMGADVVVLDRSIDALRRKCAIRLCRKSHYSTADAIERHVVEADRMIGGVLIRCCGTQN